MRHTARVADDANADTQGPRSSEAILEAAAALGPLIEANAERIEADRRLPDELVAALRQAGVFRIAFPRAWGGPEMDIVSQCRLIERLAYHDAATAWVAMICSDSGHYAARLDEATAREIYPDLDLLTAGFLFPAGQAVRVDGGYRVSGRWAFGSGSLHADRVVGGCFVHDAAGVVFGANGLPELRVVWLPRDEVTIHDTWHTTGLAGTGSNDYSVEDAFVPAAHGFHPFEVGPRPEALYRYHGFFFANLPAVAIGAAQRMLDELRELAGTKVLMPSFTLMKDDARVQADLAEASAALGAARAYQDHTLGHAFEVLDQGGDLRLDDRAAVGLMSVHAVQTAHRVAEQVCSIVGSASIQRSAPFDRRRRDIATMTSHIIGAHRSFLFPGQLLLGDDPPFSMF